MIAGMSIIREAIPADHAGLLALARTTWADAFGDSMSESDLRAHLEETLSGAWLATALEEDVFLVAEEDGQLVGFVQTGAMTADTPQCDPASTREVIRLYVIRSHQNAGLGSSLMRAALDHPAAVEALRLSLDVWEMNTGAIRFYKRHGFEVVGERAFEVASGEETDPDLIMVLDRNPAAAT